MEILITIFLLDLLSLLIPGQDTVLLSQLSLKFGKSKGLKAALGIATSQLLLCLLAIIGLLSLVNLNPNIIPFIKTLGTIYLVYLGIKIFKNAGKTFTLGNESKKAISNRSPFLMGFISCTLNVEAILFSLSLFSVIIPVESSILFKLGASLLIFIDTFIWYSLVVFALSKKAVQNKIKLHVSKIERVLGVLLIFIGVKNSKSD